jgi:hypothetical protein
MPLLSFIRATLAIILFALALPSAAQIVIGQIAAFSGPLAPTGTHMRAGAQLYFDAVNAEAVFTAPGFNCSQRMTATKPRRRFG